MKDTHTSIMPLHIQPPQSMALICAITARDQEILARARDQLAARLGSIRLQGPIFPFDYTTYYTEEMGPELIKQPIWFDEQVDPAALPHLKHQTMEVEKELAERAQGKILRQANIDPGLVSIESLVLASTKYSGHRICIAPGLYAETTLLFRKGRYRPFEWTYPDYQTDEVQEFLLQVRTHLLQNRVK